MLLFKTFTNKLARNGCVIYKSEQNVKNILQIIVLFLFVQSTKSFFIQEEIPISITNAIGK